MVRLVRGKGKEKGNTKPRILSRNSLKALKPMHHDHVKNNMTREMALSQLQPRLRLKLN